MDDILESFPKLFVDIILKKWMNSHIQIMDQLSKVNLWNKENQQMEQIYNARDDMMNILSYADSSNLCHVIKYFPELNKTNWKEDITFTLSNILRYIE